MPGPVVFINYSRKDEKEKDHLLSHLGVLQHAGLIETWSDDRISAGGDWEKEIYDAMTQAKVAILLVSANSLTSEFILKKEMRFLLERREREGLVIYPIIAKHCAWKAVGWLAKMGMRPRNGRPVWSDGGSHADEDLAAIAGEIAAIVEKSNVDQDKLDGSPPPVAASYRSQEQVQNVSVPATSSKFEAAGGYHLRNIRKLLTTAFTDAELRQLCYDEPQFRTVYEQFSTGMGKGQMIQQLIEYCDRKGLMDELLYIIRDEAPGKYAEFADRLRHGGAPSMPSTVGSGPGVSSGIDEVKHLQNLITEKTRRLHALQLQAAQFGISTPPEVTTQIEDLEVEIAELKEQLKS